MQNKCPLFFRAACKKIIFLINLSLKFIGLQNAIDFLFSIVYNIRAYCLQRTIFLVKSAL